MLEIKNVVREYHPKKGIPVKALDNVSVKFPEKGLVFILGKSGSGKSTLLNVMGGLDKIDSGEIIIKGKSSKDFSQADFDSYRNTYLGFIFQEYNVLNEFTVGANIALALELQGKKATNEEINTILDTVDLQGFAKRKPTELSGGQKQRVAIARALVKNPEIIMADEPTGALDSATGIQVFDTLKKLSQTKLVIVVSHDREFAEMYGDRVIEFKDGKIISDIEKYKSRGEIISDSVSIVDDKIIQIKKGYKLTKIDVDKINEYLENNDAILTVDERTNKDVRKIARIDNLGNKESFKDTDESAIVIKDDKNFKLIKSRLPFKDSFKIGASGLKSKPIRLFFTILLCFVAFAMFGLVDSFASYNKYDVTTNSIIDSKLSSAAFVKENVVDYGEGYSYRTTNNLSESDLAALKDKTGVDYKGVYKTNNMNLNSLYKNPGELNNMYVISNNFAGFIYMSSDELINNGFDIKGNMPTSDDEVAISEYWFRHFQKAGTNLYTKDGINYIPALYDNTDDVVKNVENFINAQLYININNKYFKIVAIVDTKFNYDSYKSLDTKEMSGSITFYLKMQELQSTVLYGYDSMVFTNEGYIEKEISGLDNFVGHSVNDGTYNDHTLQLSYSEIYNYLNQFNNIKRIVKQDVLTSDNYKFFDSSKTSLSDWEILVDSAALYQSIQGAISENALDADQALEFESLFSKYDEIFNAYVKESFDNLSDDEKSTVFNNDFNNYFSYVVNTSFTTYDGQDIVGGLNVNEFDANNTGINIKTKSLKKLYEDYSEALCVSFANTYSLNYIDSSYYVGMFNNIDIKIVGVYFDNSILHPNADYLKSINDVYYDNSYVIVSDSAYSTFDVEISPYAFAIGKMPTDSKSVSKLVELHYTETDASITDYYVMKNAIVITLEQVNSIIETLATVLLYVGIVIAVFASFLLMNFISTSISYKKREIGILRAVGAKSSDVFGIFFNEALIIAFINFVLAFLGSLITVFLLNRMLRNNYGIMITILSFGIRQVALMLAISLVVALIASFLPVYSIAKKRPVDAIRNN